MSTNINFRLFSRNALLEMIADFQSERMDEQRALLPGLKRISLNNATNRPGMNNSGSDSLPSTQQPPQLPPTSDGIGTPPDDAFLDMLMRCQVSFGLMCSARFRPFHFELVLICRVQELKNNVRNCRRPTSLWTLKLEVTEGHQRWVIPTAEPQSQMKISFRSSCASRAAAWKTNELRYLCTAITTITVV